MEARFLREDDVMKAQIQNWLVLSCLSAAIPRLACDAQDVDARVVAAADSLLKARESSGWSGAVIIERKGQVILRAGYGMADRERKVPFTTNTVAQIGSLTKQFTAAAVAALAQERKLAFTDPVSKHLPEVQGAMRAVTLHQLLSHSSGLQQDCGRDFDRITATEIVSRCLNGVDLKARGTYSYSNLGYSVLGIVVERVSKRSLESFMGERFFRPLGLDNIAYTFPSLPASSGPAACYLNGVRQRPISENIADMNGAFWNLKGNGGIQASAERMYQWYRALRDAKALPQDMIRTMLTPHAPNPQSAGVAYGYGWNVRVDTAGRVTQASHSGSDGVCWAAIIWLPQSDGFIYVTGNSDTQASGQIASALLRILRDAASQ